MPPAINLAGMTFGELKVIERSGSTEANGFATWRCLCNCGNETTVTSVSLRSGRTKSCGHLRVDVIRELKTKHGGRAGRRSTVEYQAWLDLVKRCSNPAYVYYENYGGRGITVCDEWRNGDGERTGYGCFLAHIGPSPGRGYSVDRMNNEGHYAPGNVKWSTAKEQANNRRERKDSARLRRLANG